MTAVAPRPLFWVTTIDSITNKLNFAPFTAVAPICNHPPMIALSIQYRADGSLKQTAKNISDRGEFVLNLVGNDQLKAALACADPAVSIDDRAQLAKLQTLESATVKIPRIAGCSIGLECKTVEQLSIGEAPRKADLFLAKVVHAWLDDPLFLQGEFDQGNRFSGIGSLGLEWFLTRDGLQHQSQPYAERSRYRP